MVASQRSWHNKVVGARPEAPVALRHRRRHLAVASPSLHALGFPVWTSSLSSLSLHTLENESKTSWLTPTPSSLSAIYSETSRTEEFGTHDFGGISVGGEAWRSTVLNTIVIVAGIIGRM